MVNQNKINKEYPNKNQLKQYKSYMKHFFPHWDIKSDLKAMIAEEIWTKAN